ncbi:ABC transporter transmembrane region family protein [Orientia tsutsugamushi str. UT76]|nr:ABC transporter transmembrane region family protein [Orientia tsutsugamushi str. UT76]
MKQIPIINKFVQELNPFQEALEKCRLAFYIIFCFAFCINILMLITPLYSLQVLDRVIGSGNIETLIMLSLIIGTIYFVHTLMQIARSFTMIRIGIWLENNISPMLLSHSIASSAIRQSLSTGQLLRDFQLVKNFLTSVGLNTILDAPWTIPYVIVIFMIHPYIGYLTVVGGIVIIILAFVNAAITNRNLGEATEYSIKALNQVEIANRNAEVIEAMGMMKNVSSNWSKINQLALSKQTLASYRNGILSNISRFVRYIMQMCVTGIGAYIVVKTGGREMSTGGMIASSILVGRALAPVDNAIELWKQINNTLKAYKRINDSFKVSNLRDKAMPMLKVTGKLDVESVSFSMPYLNPTTKQVEYKPILKNVSFDLNPGEVLAIIGPSAAGKSTLSRLLVGVWRCSSGL